MKKLLFLQNALTFLLLFGVCHAILAQEQDKQNDPDLIRLDASQAFLKLTDNSVSAIRELYQSTGNGTKSLGSETKFSIADVTAPVKTTIETRRTDSSGRSSTQTETSSTNIDSKLGIKIWFELTDGTYVNPIKRKWKSQERCYVNIEAAVPVYISLFQNSPDNNNSSVQIYPNAKYPDSYKLIQPGQPYRLPVIFQTDNNKADENLSVIFVRSDWSGIQNINHQSTPVVVANNGTAQIDAQITSGGCGTMKSMNERLYNDDDITVDEVKANIGGDKRVSDQLVEEVTKSINESSSDAKLQVIDAVQETSTQLNDVCLYLFGANQVGQWVFTISKEK